MVSKIQTDIPSRPPRTALNCVFKFVISGILILLIPNMALSQDPGIRDTVRIEGDSLIVGQSRPLRLTICNDNEISVILIPFKITSLDSGFAIFDSVRYVGRMADPSVLEARINYPREVNGNSPDTVQLGAFNMTSSGLPPGNLIVAEIYFTGLKVGSMKVDTASLLTGSNAVDYLTLIVWLPDGSWRPVYPEFSTKSVKVVQGTAYPTISLDFPFQRAAVGELISFQTKVSSPAGFPVAGTLAAFTKYDNHAISPANAPSFSYNSFENAYEFSWSSNEEDVGIWKAVVTACDSVGSCVSNEAVIQIVENSNYLVELSATESPGINYPSSVKSGNFDNDQLPEIASTGWGLNYTTPFSVYDNNGSGTFSEVFSDVVPEHPRKGLQIGFIDGDEYLDMVQFMTGNVNTTNEIRVLLGSGENGFPTLVSTPLPDTTWALVGSMGKYNNDEHLDYALGGESSLKIYKGISNSKFQLASKVNVSDSIMSLVSKDFNNDGYDDFVVGHRNGIKVYLGNSSGTPVYLVSYNQTFGTANIEVTNDGADFNGDNYYDLCIATPSVGDSTSELVVYLGNGDGTFEQRVARIVKGQIVANSPGDFNGDGLLDIAYLNSGLKYAAIIFGDGDGFFTNELRYPVDHFNPRKMIGLDADVDGDMDIAVFSYNMPGGSSLYLFENQSNPGGFSVSSVGISGEDNAQLELVSASGKVLNRNANTMPSSDYYRRDLNLNDKLDDYATMNLVESGNYKLTVRPDPSQPIGTPFTVEFEVDGKANRLAKDAVMMNDKYEFGVKLSAGESVVPRPGNFIYINPPLFSWPNESAVDFQLATDLDFYSVLIDTMISTSRFQPAAALSVFDTTTYYWRIKPSGSGDFSPIYAFNLIPASPACGDVDGIAGNINFLDLVFMVDYFFLGGAKSPNFEAADLTNDGALNVVDLTLLVDYLFRSGEPPVCN